LAQGLGMSSAELWALLIGATAWLPVVLTTWVARGGADLWAFLWLAVPYVGLVTALLASGGRETPPRAWSRPWSTALAAYSVYLWALLEIWTLRQRGPTPAETHAHWLAVLGVCLAATGWVGVWRRRRAESDQQVSS
jgi:peptidoglycan/LPS O-acetylase OafA/YrhL